MRNIIGFTALSLLASVAFPATAKAAILNGDFEDGLTNWEAIGDYRVEISTFGSNPVKGTSQAFLSTAYNEVIGLDANGNEIIGGDAAIVPFITGYPNLEEFLGISTFFGDKSLYDIATAEPIEGSAIKQTFMASAGQKLSFSWNFLTNESVEQAAIDDFTYPDYNDFAFVSLQSSSFNELFSLADTISNFSSSSTAFYNETGFQTFSYTIPQTGTYTLGIGVVDVGEPTRISALLIDEAAVVPEPSCLFGFLPIGIWGILSRLKRRKLPSLIQ